MRPGRRFGIWLAVAAWLAPAGPALTAPAEQGWESEPSDPRGHSGEVLAVATSGPTMATAGLDGLAKVWDLRGPRGWALAHRVDLAGHDGPVLAVALSPDGKVVATGGADRTVRLWDSALGTPLATLRGHSGAVEALAFSPDGKLVASGGLDTSIRLWDAGARGMARTLDGHEQGVRGLAFAPDGKSLASAARDRTVRLWGLGDGANSRTLGRHDAPAWCVAFAPDGKLVASGGLDRTVRLWRVDQGGAAAAPDAVDAARARFSQLAGQQRRAMAGRLEGPEGGAAEARLVLQLEPPAGPQPGNQGQFQPNQLQAWPAGADVVALRFSPAGAHLAAALSDLAASTAPGSVRFFIVPGSAPSAPMTRPVLRGHLGPIRGVAFAPDGIAVATVGGDTSVRLWESPTAKPLAASVGRPGPVGAGPRAMAHLDPVESVAISPDGRLVATASGPGGVGLWDSGSRSRVGRLLEPSGPVRAVAISPDGKVLATGGDGRVVTLRDLATGLAIATLEGHLDAITRLAFSPDGKALASGSKDASVTTWDVARRAEVATLARHTSAITALAFRPGGTLLATASLDDTVKLWDLPSGRLVDTLEARQDVVDALAFSPDGSALASGDRSGTIRLWDPDARAERRSIRASAAPIRALAFAPDGATIFGGGDDRAIRRWDAADGRAVAHQPRAHPGPILAMAIAPGGKALATGGPDRELKLWDVDARLAPVPFADLEGKVRQLAVSPDGRTLATASPDRPLRIWDVAQGRERTPPIPHPQGAEVRLAFSPDGKTLASLPVAPGQAARPDDAGVKFHDVATGRARPPAMVAAPGASAIAFAPDGKSWAMNEGGVIHLREAGTGSPMRDLAGAPAAARSMAFSPDGKALAAGLVDGSVATWDAAAPGKAPAVSRPSHRPVDVLAFSPDGRSIAIGGADRVVRVLDAATGAARLALRGHRRPVTGLAFSPDGRLVASAADGEPALFAWDAESGEVASNPTLPDASGGEGLACLAFSPDGRVLFAGGDRGVTAFDMAGGRRPPPNVPRGGPKPGQARASLLGHASAVLGLNFAGGGSKLVTRSEDGMIKVWDLLDNNRAIRTFGELDFKAQSLALRPDGKAMAVAPRLPENRLKAQGVDAPPGPPAPRAPGPSGQKMADEVKVWDLETGQALGMISGKATKGGVDRVASLVYSPDGKALATASLKGLARLWDAGTLEPGVELGARPRPAEAVQFTPDGKALLGADASGLVTLWDVGTGKARASFAHDGGVNRVVLSPDGKLVATAGGRAPNPQPGGVASPPDLGPGSGGDVRLWDLATGRRVAVLPMASGRVMRLAFSADGKALAASTTAPLATVWDVASASPVATLAWPSGEARALAFSPDGKALAIGGEDEALRVWDVPAGTLRAEFAGHVDAINGVAFSPDGRAIATAGRDAAVKLWDVPPGAPGP